MKQRRFLWCAVGALAVLAAGAAAALAVYLYRGNPFDPIDRGKSPVADQYVGQTKAALIAQYGRPTHEWEGHYGNPSLAYAEQHDPAVTLTYVRSTGALYLSFERKGDEWVCFSSCWMPNGWAF